jgi:Reverse transcriptase (RNA-dependent DNA polymerase)
LTRSSARHIEQDGSDIEQEESALGENEDGAIAASYIASVIAKPSHHACPTNHKEAMNSTEREDWQAAEMVEWENMVSLNVFDIVPRPVNKMVVKCRWVYTRKSNHRDHTMAYKARLVAKCFTQIPGEDFDFTSSPIARAETIRLVLSTAATADWEIRQLDIKTSYIHEDLDREIYMEPPEDFLAAGEVLKFRWQFMDYAVAGSTLVLYKLLVISCLYDFV